MQKSPSLAKPATDRASEQTRERSLRILLVEDDRDTVETFTMLLKAEGYDIRFAYDGPSGLEAARTYEPDAVLLDIGLPGMNGFDLARQIRQQCGSKRPFLIAITAYGDEKSRKCSEQVGIDLHLVKPIEMEGLQMVLEKFRTVLRPELE